MHRTLTTLFRWIGFLPPSSPSGPRMPRLDRTVTPPLAGDRLSSAPLRDKLKHERHVEPAMAGMLTHAVQRTPPAAASPGLPPVDPAKTTSRGVPDWNEPSTGSGESVEGRSDLTTPGQACDRRPDPALEGVRDPGPNRRMDTGESVKTSRFLPGQAIADACPAVLPDLGPQRVVEGLAGASKDCGGSELGDARAGISLASLVASERPGSDAPKDCMPSPAGGPVGVGDGHVEGREAAFPASPASRVVVDSAAKRSPPYAGEAASPRRRMPPRVAARPRPEEWTDDELLTLPEAAALFWPDGPITTNTLRTAGRDGTLAITKVAGKFFTTSMAIRRMGHDKAGEPLVREAAVPDTSSPRALFEAKLEEARRQGRDRKRRQRAAKRSVAPQEGAGR